jgi:epsin
LLKQFHFIDQNGKDQGINVRNRSKELVELLSDVEKIRAERKKAKTNRTKYSGYEGGGGGFSSSSQYGGFSSSDTTSYGGYDGRVYGDGGGFGGESSGTYDGATQARRDNFEEYDEFEEGAKPSSSRRKADSISSPTSRREGKKPEASKSKEPEVDLFDFGDEPTGSTAASKAPASLGFNTIQPPSTAATDDDDFDDFQSAPAPAAPSSASNAFSLPAPISSSKAPSTQFAAPKPQSGTQGQSINDLFSSVSPPPSGNNTSASSSTILSPPSITPQQPTRPGQPANYQPSQPNYFTSVPLAASSAASPAARTAVSTTPGGLGKPIAPIGGAAGKKPAGDAFAGLLGGASAKKDAGGAGGNKGQTMADLARQKTSAGIWGGGSSTSIGGAGAAMSGGGGASKTPGQAQQPKLGNGLDDLLG